MKKIIGFLLFTLMLAASIAQQPKTNQRNDTLITPYISDSTNMPGSKQYRDSTDRMNDNDRKNRKQIDDRNPDHPMRTDSTRIK
jgi:hypothetical protein